MTARTVYELVVDVQIIPKCSTGFANIASIMFEKNGLKALIQYNSVIFAEINSFFNFIIINFQAFTHIKSP